MNLNDPDLALTELTAAVTAGHPETIARTAVKHVWPLYASHSEVLSATIIELPAAVLDRHPVLRILHPMTAVHARTEQQYKPTLSTQDARALTSEEVDFLTMAQMIAFRICGDLQAALVYARRLEERLLQVPLESRDRMDGPLWFFYHQIGTTLLASGDTSRALRQFATARQIGKLSPQPYAERMALGRSALAHAVRGTLEDAERALAQAETMPMVTTVHQSASLASEAIARALIAGDRMSDEISDYLAASEVIDTVELNWAFDLLARSRAYLARQRPEDALEAIRLATGAHPTQQGSFGADVTAAMSIEAYLTLDTARAWQISSENPKVGVLTRLATAHLALHDGRLNVAALELQMVATHSSLGPAQRAELTLLSGWLEFARTGEVEHITGQQISRIAQRTDRRRLLTMMPRQLMTQVKGRLDADSACSLDAATGNLVSIDLQDRPILTAGELRILNELPAQNSTAQMAATFHVSPNTIKSQLRSLYRKLGCSTREEAVRAAIRVRLLAMHPPQEIST